MYCRNCKATIADNSSFCPYCGTTQYSASYPAPAGTWPVQNPPAQAPTQPPPQNNPYNNPYNVPQPPEQPQCQPAPPPVQNWQPAPQYAYQAPQYSPPAAKPRRQKTRFDIICGVVFIVLGLAAMAYFVYNVYVQITLLAQYYNSFADYLSFFARYNIVGILDALLYLAGFFSGFFLLLAGIFSLNSGKGRAPAITALALIIVSVICGIVTMALLSSSFSEFIEYWGIAFSYAWVAYTSQLVYILAICVLLPIKKHLKKHKKNSLLFKNTRPRCARPPSLTKRVKGLEPKFSYGYPKNG